jgi:hypothetical protein
MIARDLLPLLLDAARIVDDRRFHPEPDVLHHLLQTYQLAWAETQDVGLRAAALVHDVGKVIELRGHADHGADLLDGILAPRVVWLVKHHLDLLHHPDRTRWRLRGTCALQDLQRLRSWDLRARSAYAEVLPAQRALAMLVASPDVRALDPVAGEPAPLQHDEGREWIGEASASGTARQPRRDRRRHAALASRRRERSPGDSRKSGAPCSEGRSH